MAELFDNKYRIPSARAQWHGYDNGMYFVTICTKDKQHWFGIIRNGEMQYSVMGQVAVDCMVAISVHCPYTKVVASVVMPNHVHMIVSIDGNKVPHQKRIVETFHETSLQEWQTWLSVVVRQYKSAVTRYAKSVGLPFSWQTRFYDHIIRDQQSFETIFDYIKHNVDSWEIDKLYT